MRETEASNNEASPEEPEEEVYAQEREIVFLTTCRYCKVRIMSLTKEEVEHYCPTMRVTFYVGKYHQVRKHE